MSDDADYEEYEERSTNWAGVAKTLIICATIVALFLICTWGEVRGYAR